MKKIEMLVLTGGPCGGKSTVINYMEKNFGDHLVIVPEVATSLLQNGWPAPDPWSQEWQDSFQAEIVRVQKESEEQAIIKAQEIGAELIICDRGILDGAAYLAGGVQEFSEKFGVDIEEALSRYDMVLHLESLATLNPELYQELKDTNPDRFESVEKASEREIALREAWAAHPKKVHLKCGPGEVIHYILSHY